jgi:hypothetical protein
MRKEIVGQKVVAAEAQTASEWVDLPSIARVQLTSEDPAFPIENALSASPTLNASGWRANSPGVQTISILFDAPRDIRRIVAHFVERNMERSQEFLLRYSSARETDREIVRQQWTFSPNGSQEELEDYVVELESVTKLELVIDPDRGRRNSVATLHALRLA